MSATATPLILHLAIDVNTPQRPLTTHAIERFVEALDEDFTNVVIAYQRRASPLLNGPEECSHPGHRLFHFPFVGLKFGIGLLPAMHRAARRTIALLEREGIRPDLVHAHKLTFEGIAGWYVARHFGVPLFVSLRGEVETKIFRRKPGLRRLLRRISADAARLYFVSAWFRDEFHRHVPAAPAKERLLPNIVRNIAPAITARPPGDAFVSVLNLDTWRRKGLRWLLDGLALAVRREPAIRLDIIGGGSPAAVARVEAMIAARGLDKVVTLVGPLANDAVIARLPGYRALLLPSLNETFGMVYVEALFAGVPVLFTAGTAIDGYLDGLDVAVAVRPRDVTGIADAVVTLFARSSAMRAAIVDAAPQLFRTFDADTMIAAYRADVQAVLASNQL